ncbi:MAG TPA: class I SAM-dependent methyltransferase [Solirubrobacteraceae bacterium]|nr:class I SAM-dependent methyltransferase [Solirubrobacteraceae bacterium]
MGRMGCHPPASGHRGEVLARRDGYAVIDCERCGWAHIDPLPDGAELALMYERTYYQELNRGWIEKDRSEQAYWDLEHADKLADWREILGRETGALLDVGCSGGLLLEHAIARGWSAEGIEPSEQAVAEVHAHGLTVHAGLYQEVELPSESFDVVHCKLVAEHLPDPGDFLAWAACLLSPGGVVTIHVPNDFNPHQLAARDVLGLEDWWVAPPFHLNYFSFDSLERLLARCGFVPAGRDATFPMEWFLLMGENYVGDSELGASAHSRRMLLESRLDGLGQRRALHKHLASQGLGREAIVHGRWKG